MSKVENNLTLLVELDTTSANKGIVARTPWTEAVLMSSALFLSCTGGGELGSHRTELCRLFSEVEGVLNITRKLARG